MTELGRVPGRPSQSAREHHTYEKDGRIGEVLFPEGDRGRARAQKAARIVRTSSPNSFTRPIHLDPNQIYPMENPADPSGPPIWRRHSKNALNPGVPADGTQANPYPDGTH